MFFSLLKHASLPVKSGGDFAKFESHHEFLEFHKCDSYRYSNCNQQNDEFHNHKNFTHPDWFVELQV